MVSSLFSKIFGLAKGKTKSTGVIKTELEQVPLLLEGDFLLQKHELEDFCAKKISEIKYLHSKAGDLVAIISNKELEGKENERLNRAVFTAKKQLTNQLSRLLEKIDPKERGQTLEDARAYAGESYALMVNEVMSFRKSIVYTSFYLKDEMKELGEALQEIINLLQATNTEFSKSGKLFEFEKVKKDIKIALQKIKRRKETLNLIEELSKSIGRKQTEINLQEEKISEKKNGKESIELKKLEEDLAKLTSQKQDLKTEISALLINIDRPLQRFKQLVDSGRWRIPKEEKDMLQEFIDNPILALKKDPKAEVFKKVLNEVRKAVEEGEVELKEKEKEKRLQALQEIINFDFFGNVFWKMNEIQKKQGELNKALEESPAKAVLENEEKKLGVLEKELSALEEKMDSVRKEEQGIGKEIEKEIGIIKKFAEECLGKTVLLEEEEQ
jgi:hypothetical protein